MQPASKPGFDHGTDVVQALLDPFLQPVRSGIRADTWAVVASGSPGTVRTHVTDVTHPWLIGDQE